ncbi:MAG: VOC family protein [Candidatus Acidiferrum sp.]
MLRNRSVPADIVLPHLVYEDVDTAVNWLRKAFGFKEHYRHGNPSSGAQMHLGNAWIMLSRAREGRSSPAQMGAWTQSLTVFVEDVQGHFEKAKAARVRIIEEPHETIYGEFQYAAMDLEGHLWLFSRHATDIAPGDWGARVAEG